MELCKKYKTPPPFILVKQPNLADYSYQKGDLSREDTPFDDRELMMPLHHQSLLGDEFDLEAGLNDLRVESARILAEHWVEQNGAGIKSSDYNPGETEQNVNNSTLSYKEQVDPGLASQTEGSEQGSEKYSFKFSTGPKGMFSSAHNSSESQGDFSEDKIKKHRYFPK